MRLNGKRILYMACFFLFCLIDQRTKTASGLDGWLESFRGLTGVVMAVLILSHYHLEDFKKRKIFYLVWSLACVIGGAAFLIYGQPLAYFLNRRIVITAAVFLMGMAAICTTSAVFLDKRKPPLNRKFLCAWFVMMFLMVISRSAERWPLLYAVMFGCFYLTDYTKEEQEQLFQALLDGIILGFFMLQGWCFAFRPYDDVRYAGVYSNCNMNALFYLVVLAAVLSKLICAYHFGYRRWIKLYYWTGTGAVLGFLFMTISRTGWVTAIAMVFVALLCLWRVTQGKNLFVFLVKNGLAVMLAFVLVFPLVFGAVRYLPPLFHHPVWFYGEWHEDKVHSWDKWDSEKFIDFDELMTIANKRLALMVKDLQEKFMEKKETPSEPQAPHLEVEGVNLARQEAGGEPAAGETGQIAAAADAAQVSDVNPVQQQLYEEALAAGYAIDPADRNKPLLVRSTIYRYYFHLLNFTGHPDPEIRLQLMPKYSVGHAHNIYLQFGVKYGIPVMILLILLFGWSAVEFAKRFLRERSLSAAGQLLFILIPMVFGLLEYCWGAGSLTLALMFVVWRGMVCDERK